MPGVSISNKVLAIYQEIWGQELSFKSKGEGWADFGKCLIIHVSQAGSDPFYLYTGWVKRLDTSG